MHARLDIWLPRTKDLDTSKLFENRVRDILRAPQSLGQTSSYGTFLLQSLLVLPHLFSSSHATELFVILHCQPPGRKLASYTLCSDDMWHWTSCIDYNGNSWLAKDKRYQICREVDPFDLISQGRWTGHATHGWLWPDAEC